MNRFDRVFLRRLIVLDVLLALLFLYALLMSAPILLAKQTQPDAKRVKEIQIALEEHGYVSGKTWHETQEMLRSIAEGHGWQTKYAPDARVLILLGLGNKYSDPWVATLPGGHLDGGPDGE